jgi:hypothetical protein
MSVYSMMYLGIGPFGAMAAGFAAGRFGAPVTLMAGSAVSLAAAAVFAAWLPSIRPMTRQLIRERQGMDEVSVTEALDTAAASR